MSDPATIAVIVVVAVTAVASGWLGLHSVREARDALIDIADLSRRVSFQEMKTRHLERRLDNLTVRVRRLEMDGPVLDVTHADG